MAAYVLIDRLSVTDPQTFRDYPGPARAAVTGHGGRYVLPYGPRQQREDLKQEDPGDPDHSDQTKS